MKEERKNKKQKNKIKKKQKKKKKIRKKLKESKIFKRSQKAQYRNWLVHFWSLDVSVQNFIVQALTLSNKLPGKCYR